ncbi:MAG: mechanosensitive ion channel [Actinobacteria bacterium]|nr:mechanosensitive ion channel [Actinomycetota bacterium]
MITANLLLDALRDLWEGFITRLPSLLTGLVVFIAFYFLARGVRFVIARSLKRVKASEHAARLVSRLGFIATMVVGGLVGLGVMGVNAGALVASLGLVSVGIGFALKDVVENFLAGIILILQRPFVVGDVVRFGDVEGTVEDVRVRDTVIRTYDGRQVFVPNANIFRTALINNNRNRRRRLDFGVSIAYPEDIAAALSTAAAALAGVEGILADPAPLVVVESLAESSVSLRAYFWVDPECVSILEVKSQAIAAAKRALEEAGIEIPYPVLTVRSGKPS